jgi:hypothetical protein
LNEAKLDKECDDLHYFIAGEDIEYLDQNTCRAYKTALLWDSVFLYCILERKDYL